MAKTDFQSVPEYLATLPKHTRETLERVRLAIRKAVPGAEEAISYQIPALKLEGSAVIYFAGWKEHYSVYPATKKVVASLQAELVDYELSKGTIRFPLSEPVPTKLIAAIAQIRAQETLALLAERKAKRSKISQKPKAPSDKSKAPSKNKKAPTKKPRASSKKPRASSKKPRASSKKPKTSSKKPRASSKRR